MHPPINNPQVKTLLDAMELRQQSIVQTIRQIIFDTAAKFNGIGEIDETVKWNEISYLTHKPKSGTTIRLAAPKDDKEKIHLSVHCQTTIIGELRALYPDAPFNKNRSLIIDCSKSLPNDIIHHLVYNALTYHLKN